ncbi:MAG TPA: peptidylprolyl isomerase [Verrucomicrobiae bacterium]|jgi:parvulin-like peptidyl-prolyl isomerase
MKLNKIIILACAVIAVRSATAQPANPIAAASNPVVASGTGVTINRGDLDEALASHRAQLMALAPAQQILIQKELLTNLIDSKLVLAKATDADKAAGAKAADLQMTADMENAGSKEAFDMILKTNGVSEAMLRSRLTDQETITVVLQRVLNVNVSDADIKGYYDAHTAEFEQPAMAHISHILIYTVDPTTEAALPESELVMRRRMAESVVKAARAGQDFEALAKQVSEDPGSKALGGDLLPFPRGEMAPEIDSAVFSMTNNQISDVITTSVGYQIIKVLDLVPAKKTSYLTAAQQIKQVLTRQKFGQLATPYLDGLQRAANVQILDPTLSAPTPAM